MGSSSNPLANAIAKLEGFGAGSNIPTLANNPGNLELGDIGYGTMQAANNQQITVFPSTQAGWAALQNQLDKITGGTSHVYSPDVNLQQFGQTYSGGDPNYGNQLASLLGTTPETPLSQVNNPAGTAPGGSGTQQTGTQANMPGDYMGWMDPKTGQPKFMSSSSWFTDLPRVITLLLGVLLFAAGIFSFKQTQTIIQNTTKAAKKVAAVAA